MEVMVCRNDGTFIRYLGTGAAAFLWNNWTLVSGLHERREHEYERHGWPNKRISHQAMNAAKHLFLDMLFTLTCTKEDEFLFQKKNQGY